jgi:hypothetical protein
MARLPNYEKAFIEPAKIRDYILSPIHPIGRFKAVLFQGMGYTQENWERLIDDIRLYHLALDAEPIEKSKYGQKYAISGLIKGPNGKIAMFKSIWIILEGKDIPRFITIYPEGGGHEI